MTYRRKRRGAVTVSELIARHGEPRLRGGRHTFVKGDDSPTRQFSVASTYSNVDDGDEPTWAHPTHPHHRRPTKAQLWWAGVLISTLIALSSFQAWGWVA